MKLGRLILSFIFVNIFILSIYFSNRCDVIALQNCFEISDSGKRNVGIGSTFSEALNNFKDISGNQKYLYVKILKNVEISSEEFQKIDSMTRLIGNDNENRTLLKIKNTDDIKNNNLYLYLSNVNLESEKSVELYELAIKNTTLDIFSNNNTNIKIKSDSTIKIHKDVVFDGEIQVCKDVVLTLDIDEGCKLSANDIQLDDTSKIKLTGGCIQNDATPLMASLNSKQVIADDCSFEYQDGRFIVSNVVEDDSSKVEDDSSQVEDDSSKAEDDSSKVEDSSQVEEDSSQVEDDSSKVEEDSSKVEDDSSKVEEDSSKAEEDSSKVEDDSSKVEDDSSQVEDDSSQVEEDSSQVEDDSSPKSISVYEYVGNIFDRNSNYSNNVHNGNAFGEVIEVSNPETSDKSICPIITIIFIPIMGMIILAKNTKKDD